MASITLSNGDSYNYNVQELTLSCKTSKHYQYSHSKKGSRLNDEDAKTIAEALKVNNSLQQLVLHSIVYYLCIDLCL